MPFGAGPASESVVPGCIRGSRKPVIRLGVVSNRNRMWMVTKLPRGICKQIAQVEWAGWRQRISLAATQKWIEIVPGDPDLPFQSREIGFEIIIGNRPIRDRAPLRNDLLAPSLNDMRAQTKVV